MAFFDFFSKPTDSEQSYGQNVPRPPRGILSWLRDLAGGWLGPRLSQNTPAETRLTREEIRSGPQGIRYPWIPPYFDETTVQTEEMIRAYRLMLASPQVKAAFVSQITSVAALDLRIRPAASRSKRQKRRNAEIADFTRWALTDRLTGGFPELIWSVLSGGLVDGYSICEKVWAVQDRGDWANKIVIDKLKPKRVGDDAVVESDEFLNVVSVMALRYNAGERWSPANFVLFRLMPFYDSPVGMSAFRAAYSSWWMLQTVRALRSIGAEKRAFPVVWAQTGSDSQRTALENVLARLKSQNWAVVPKDVQLQVLDVAGASDAYFTSFVKDLTHEIFLAISSAILQSMEGTVADGAGNSKVHQDTAEKTPWYLSALVQSVLNNHTGGLLDDLVSLNYVTPCNPKATLGSVNLDEQLKLLQIYKGLQQMGLPISMENALDVFNITPPKNARDVLKPQQQQTAAQGNPFGTPGAGQPGQHQDEKGRPMGPKLDKDMGPDVDKPENGKKRGGSPATRPPGVNGRGRLSFSRQ